MVTKALLIDFLTDRVNVLSREHGLSDAERERILETFRRALANPYMDETQIYQQLIGGETVSDEDSANRT